MNDYLALDFEVLREAAREAAAATLKFFGRPLAIERKADGSAVTAADKAADAVFAARLKLIRPHYGWLSEESADHAGRALACRTWIIDPIDGTRAFIQGRDDWTVASCLVEDGKPMLAVVINPVRDEIYEARAGLGAFRNGRRILASGQEALCGAQIAMDAIALKKGWRAPWPGASAVAANSTIYRFALVASGVADVTFALRPKWEWDIAAGALLVREAGGKVTDAAGAPLKFNSPDAKVQGYVAAAQDLHQKVMEHLIGANKEAQGARRT